MGFRYYMGTIFGGVYEAPFGYERNGGEDWGAQYAMTDPTSVGVHLPIGSQGRVRAGDGSIRYTVTISNPGPSERFYLIGGGLS